MSQSPHRTKDLDLAARARAHGEPELSEFLERMRCIPRFLALRNSRAGSPLGGADLDDLAQEVFQEVWNQLDRYRGEAAMESWVYRFCTLKFLERRRRRGGHEAPLEAAALVPDESAPAPGAQLDDAPLHAAMAELPADEGQVVQLKHFEDLSFDAIGRRLEQSANTAKTRYYRAMARLRARLGPQLGHPEESR